MSRLFRVGELGGPDERERCEGKAAAGFPLACGVEAAAADGVKEDDDGLIPLDMGRAIGTALLLLLNGVDGLPLFPVPIFARFARGVEGAPSRLRKNDMCGSVYSHAVSV